MNDPVLPIANLLLGCLCQKLATNPNPPGHCCLRIGTDVTLDVLPEDLCCDGFGYVRIGEMFPSGQSFPEVDTLSAGCVGDRWAVRMDMGVMRCASPESCTDWTDVTTQYLLDVMAMREALCCFKKALDPGLAWTAEANTPLPLEGNCVGSILSIVVQVPGTCCIG